MYSSNLRLTLAAAFAILLETTPITAQQVELILKGGGGFAQASYRSEAYKTAHRNKDKGQAFNIALQASAHAVYGLYVNAEAGLAQNNDFLAFTYTLNPPEYIGDYRIQRFYTFFGPEYRFWKGHFFVNASVGLAKDYASRFTSGTVRKPPEKGVPLAGKGEIFARDGVVGYALGTGVRASISQHWGVLLEARLLDMTDGNTNFAYYNYVLNLGLVYKR